MVVATTLVTAYPPSLFLETPLYSHYHLFLRSFLKILSPVAHASLFSSPCPARFPPEETSLPPWKVQTRWQSSGFPILPSSSSSSCFSFSSWNKRGTAQSRQKISKSLDKGVLETPLPSFITPIFLHLPPSCKWRGFAETGEEELWTMFSIFVVVLNLPGRGEEEEEASFREWNSVPRLQDQPGEISGINSGLDIDFVKMPDRHHLPYERRVYRGEEGRDAWMIY